jgi:predicted phage replisome organizer
MAKKYYWLKLNEDFFRQKEIKKLRKIAGGDTYTVIYLKMLLLSLENEGKLYFDGIEEDFAEEIALEIDEDADNVKVTILFLIKNRLIKEFSEDESYLLNAVPKMIGKESSSAERMRRQKEKSRIRK